MSRKLTLSRYGIEHVNLRRMGAYAIEVVATDPTDSGADPKVFLYLRQPPNPGDGSVDDVFLAVASPVDMVEYPADEPNDLMPYPIFRRNRFNILVRATSLAEQAWEGIITSVTELLEALDRFDTLTLLEEVEINPSGDTNESESTSV